MAETLLKKLYNRNKELETYHKMQLENPSNIPLSSPRKSETYKVELDKELEIKQREIDRL